MSMDPEVQAFIAAMQKGHVPDMQLVYHYYYHYMITIVIIINSSSSNQIATNN